MVGPAAARQQALLALPALLALILFGAVHETAAAQCTCSNIFAAICSPFGSCSCPAKLPYKKSFIGCGPTTGSAWKVPSCRSNYGSDTILDVAVAPDGNYAAAGTRKGMLELIDVHTGDCVATAMTGTGINSLAITSDGKKMFTADYASNTIRVWHNGSATTKLSGHTDTVNAVAMVSGMTKKLVSAGQDRTLRLWDLASYKLLKTIQTGHTNFITGLAVSSDGSKAATSSQDGTIRISSLGYVSQLKVLRTPTGSSPPLSVAFTPDGKRLVAGTANSVEVWDVSSGKVVKSFMLPFSFTYSVAVSPNGKFAVSGGREGVVRFWNLSTLKEASNYAVPGGARAADLVRVAVSPDNKGAVAGAGEVLIRFLVDPNTGVGRVLGRGPL